MKKEEENKVNFKRICEETSLHGAKFIFFKKSWVVASFWIFVMLTMFALAGIIIRVYVVEFFDSTVVYNIKSPTVDLNSVYFPSVVVCNLNILRRSFIMSLLNDTKISQNVDFVQLSSLIDNYFLSGGNIELTNNEQDIINMVIDSDIYSKQYDEFVSISSETNPTGYSNVPVFHWHTIHEIKNETERQLRIYKAKYLPEVATQFRPSEMFLSINFDAGFGINHDGGGFSTDVSDTCHWFTPFVKEPGDPFDLFSNIPFARNGLTNGIEMILDAEVYDYALSKSGMEGFTLSILHHLDIPIMKNIGINILPGQSNQFSTTVELMNTSRQVRDRFTPVESQCYFEGELWLKHLPASWSFRYDMSNCMFEATLQRIEKECNCVPRYFSELVPEIEVCQGPSALCMQKLLNLMGDFRTVYDNGTDTDEPCLANCMDQKYDVRVTSAAYANKLAFVQSPEFCLVYEKLLKSCQSEKRFTLEESYSDICSLLQKDTCIKVQQQKTSTISKLITQYARENIAKVYIYLKDPFVKEIIREEKITILQFVGSIGGLASLVMGISFLSLVEIVYLVLQWLFDKIKHQAKITTAVQDEPKTRQSTIVDDVRVTNYM